MTEIDSTLKQIFPPSFLFGVATSALQIEGAIDYAKYGRGKSIWESYFEKHPELDDARVGAGHYDRMPKDVELMRSLAIESYRFSIAWPRVQPKGFGPINSQGLDFYDRLVDTLLEANIIPNATLYHWDLPQTLEDLGGWCCDDIRYYFADYAAVVARRLGDRVPMWATLNEPEVIVAGYIGNKLAPGLNNYSLRMKVVHNLLCAHGAALEVLKGFIPKGSHGIVLNLVPIDPIDSDSTEVAKLRWERDYAVYLEAIFKGAYPVSIYDELQNTGVKIKPGDMKNISAPVDFLGVNWYLRLVVDKNDKLVEIPNVLRTLMGWEVCAEAFTRTLTTISKEYKLPPIYITENGAAFSDSVESSRVLDPLRVQYLQEHLLAVSEAIKQGVDVRGYYLWSLLDNLEWSFGYSKTFGIIHVDRNTLERKPKESAIWYRDFIRANKVD